MGMAVAAATIMVGPLAGQVLDPLDPPGRVEHQLGQAAVQILAAEAEEVGVLIKIDGQFPAENLPGGLVRHLHNDAVSRDLKEFLFLLVHADACLSRSAALRGQ